AQSGGSNQAGILDLLRYCLLLDLRAVRGRQEPALDDGVLQLLLYPRGVRRGSSLSALRRAGRRCGAGRPLCASLVLEHVLALDDATGRVPNTARPSAGTLAD